ncbi:MAG: FkbM family methyltransferase [Pseudomonadales bacterium]|nr:FkbM family methyltransferase [Pseudomonadales bacterium]MDP6470808.1 FkbM family methyltransferase [Pseudomonadales bacterium]MDP6828240.1 FkbM family methyltransferase [Pseudomonadales bacterium]MDP6972319.1 FkbM family methyltransferase [Pseudomonadales bacterium]
MKNSTPSTLDTRSSALLAVEWDQNRKTFNPNDSETLSTARNQWHFGEWAELITLSSEATVDDSEKAILFALQACAHFQLGDYAQARSNLSLALRHHCDHDFLTRLLVAGVHNSLGRATALMDDRKRSADHFKQSVTVRGIPNELVVHARTVREMTRIGLLPDVADLVQEEVTALSESPRLFSEQQAWTRVLAADIEVLRAGITQAQARNQLYVTRQLPAPDRGHLDLEILASLATSQLGQDLWVLKQTNYKRGGFFIEFGASDGVLLSNTHLLESVFAWRGVCAEPNPNLFQKLANNRACAVSDACIADTTGRKIDFVLANEYGGVTSYAENDKHAEKRKAYQEVIEAIPLITISLNDFLLEQKAPRVIDYLSIDTEGSEYDILRTLDFDRWQITCITIEHNFTEQRQDIRQLLTPKGYQCTETEWDDWYFLPGVPP